MCFFFWIKTDLLITFLFAQAAKEDALNLAPVITLKLLNDHGVIAHIVFFVEFGDIPVDPSGAKHRSRLRDSVALGEVPALCIVYNDASD